MSESITIPPKHFTNWYEVLGIPPSANSDDLARVLQLLTARFRPENKETGDARRFQEMKTAFDVLSNPDRRKAFDQELRQNALESGPVYLSRDFADGVEAEIKRRLGILCLLYNQRKTNPIAPGLSIAQLENLMLTPREHLEFGMWYLKQKRLVLADDRSTLTILCEGIDFIEENLRGGGDSALQKLLRPAQENRRSGDVDRAA